MSSPAPSPTTVLEVIDTLGPPGTPFTTPEVAEEFDCTDRTVYNKLETLVDDDALETKKVGARGRVWWRPAHDREYDIGEEDSDITEPLAPPMEDGRHALQGVWLSKILDQLPAGVGVFDMDGHFELQNDRMQELAFRNRIPSKDPDQYDDWSVTDEDGEQLPPEQWPGARALRGEEVSSGVEFHLTCDETNRWMNVAAAPLRDDGDVTRAILTVKDITERKQAEQELQTSEARFRNVFSNDMVPMGVWRDDGQIVKANDALLDLLGYTREELEVGELYWTELTPPEYHQRDQRAVAEVKETGSCGPYEKEFIHKNRNRIPIVIIGGEFDERRDRGTFVAVDITERKQREQLLKKQKELLEQIATGAPLEDCLSALCSAIPRLGSGVRGSVMLADDKHESFQRPIAPDLLPTWSEGLEDAPIDDLMISMCGEAVFRAESVTCRDVTTDDRWPEEWRELCIANDVRAAHSEPILDTDGEPVGALMLCFDEPRVPSNWEHRLADFSTYIAGIAVERHQSRRALEQTNESLKRLNTASRRLIDADTGTIRDEVAELVRDVLDMEYIALWRYDETTGDIREHASHMAPKMESGAVRLPENLSEEVWETFIGNNVDVASDLDVAKSRSVDHQTASSESGLSVSPLRSRVLIPLGRHGVLCIGSTRTATFDEWKVDLAETVAATVETAWDRADGERELAQQNEELTHLDRLNTLIREINQALVEAETVDAIDDAVCEQLANSELFEFAWVGEFDADNNTVDPRTWAGIDSRSLDDLAAEADGPVSDRSPFTSAIQTGDIQVVNDIATDAQAAPWREVALDRGARSCVSLPLVYDDFVYGILTVYNGTPRHDERNIDVLAELGRTIAHAIHAVERREIHHMDRVVELTLRSTAAETPLCRLAQETRCVLEITGLVPGSNGETTVFFTATDISPDELVIASEQSLVVEELVCLSEREEGSVFKARLSESQLTSWFLDRDAMMHSLTIDTGTATLVVDVPPSVDIRSFVEAGQQAVGDLELLARRTRTRSPDTVHSLQTVFTERLTDRQQEILQLAYRSGFFESPRTQTGNELSEALDISQSTFNYHLRGGERRLFEVVFD